MRTNNQSSHRFTHAAGARPGGIDMRTRNLAFELLCNTFPTGAMALDAHGNMIFANRESLELLARWCSVPTAEVPPEIVRACEKLRRGASNRRPLFGGRLLLRHSSDANLSAVVALERSPRDRRVAVFCVLIQDRLKVNLAAGRKDQLAMLTIAERRVAKLVAEGMRNSEIAAALGKSVTTVKSQLGAVFSKLQVDSRTQLASLLRSP